jgi:hypothetical protein
MVKFVNALLMVNNMLSKNLKEYCNSVLRYIRVDRDSGRVCLAWLRRNKFRLRPSHRRRWAPPVHRATGGHAIQTYPATAANGLNKSNEAD